MERMALSRDGHVEVAVELHAHGFSRPQRGQGDEGGKSVALHLLAAESAAHARGLDHDPVSRHAEHLRDDGLDLRGVLRGGAYEQRAVLPRLGPGGVRLQVEMLLAARLELSFQPQRRGGEGLLAIPRFSVCSSVW